ncbi:MAG TPA: SpoIVB peptidase [Lachnospiraceae bacterium]|nr:SpoIVB peptidase [Lachnospiraceae bacterium]
MKRKRSYFKAFTAGVLAFAVAAAGGYVIEEKEARIRQEVSASAVSDDVVIPGGMPVGIYLETEGVLVLGTDTVTGIDGGSYAPAEHIVQAGDYIVGLDQQTIQNKKELIRAVAELNGEETILHLKRQGEAIDVKLRPVHCEGDTCRLGIWVRDNTQGLGTVTFLTGDGKFGALGHGIHDTDTNELVNISEGTVYETSIRSIRKGKDGEPGGIEGVIVYSGYNILGSIDTNNDSGIYGSIDRIDSLFTDLTPMQTAVKEEIHTGAATIRCMVDNSVRDYDIEITEIDMHTKEVNKGIVLTVTDPELLEITGGIVQGMSGSPIIQDGKLVGAVTHVFVRDSKKGYGIFIENMLQNV